LNSEETRELIAQTCDAIKFFVLEKNRRYGNSALEPIRIFSKFDDAEQINVRLDDKLMRVKNSSEERKNDHADLIGYLILKCVKKGWIDFSDLID
jgi:hypothetical protein